MDFIFKNRTKQRQTEVNFNILKCLHIILQEYIHFQTIAEMKVEKLNVISIAE